MSFKYETAAGQTLMSASSSSLAASAAVLGDTPYDNSNSANLYFWGDIELVGAFSVAPIAGKVVECYLAPAPDGANYSDTDNTTPNPSLLAGHFVLRNTTSSQRIVLRNVPLPPWLFKVYLRNQTDQTLNSAFVVKVYLYREQ
jgi:hypothetical protein